MLAVRPATDKLKAVFRTVPERLLLQPADLPSGLRPPLPSIPSPPATMFLDLVEW